MTAGSVLVVNLTSPTTISIGFLCGHFIVMVEGRLSREHWWLLDTLSAHTVLADVSSLLISSS